MASGACFSAYNIEQFIQLGGTLSDSVSDPATASLEDGNYQTSVGQWIMRFKIEILAV